MFTQDEVFKTVDMLSGGEKVRLALCKIFKTKPNVLVLDEPTNHLDITSVEWLEDFLKNYSGSYIVISHDRYFLDAVTNRTFEIENTCLTQYKGNYTRFLHQKEENKLAMQRVYDNTQREIKRIEGIIEQQKRWNREKNLVTARSKQHQVDKIKEELVAPDSELETLSFSLEPERESGQDVLMCYDLAKSFDSKRIFSNLSMHIKKGE